MNKNKRFVIAETILTSRICKQHLYNVTDNLLFHQLVQCDRQSVVSPALDATLLKRSFGLLLLLGFSFSYSIKYNRDICRK
jgi:hypothetical protein